MLTDIYKAKTAPKKELKPPKKAKKEPQSADETEESDNDKPKKRGRPAKARLDKDGNEKAKRAPSAYNNYMAQRVKVLKEEQPETPGKDLFKIAAAEWKNLDKQTQEQYKM